MIDNSSLHILLADDDVDDQFLVKEAFTEVSKNVQCESVSSEKELFARLESGNHLPDLVILDWNLRPGAGSDIVQSIRRNPVTSSLPILVMSTSSVTEDIKHAYLQGANSYIIKPSSYADLVRTFASLYDFWANIVKLPPHN
ncbi:response regulator [Siphonobacter sp. SORGH_AS_1065]|uniref:response regulator n=1 Tax=Siphonobacter sp. SORGH_AS_1065 TaxID=3041795 RepID=UPI002786F6CB|nr:response regulator [Siphonobacter sp. SORGH_AS_1065]MDQ1088182.1 CheY-like chemotaxis protein [Siphonobacter sp. SORGH_AS_1065]